LELITVLGAAVSQGQHDRPLADCGPQGECKLF
jgi:hypothetical protein